MNRDYDEHQDCEETQEVVKPKKKKKRRGRTAFLVIFFIFILPLIIIGSIILSAYKNYKIPDKEDLAESTSDDYLVEMSNQLDCFLEKEGEEPLSLSLNSKVLNSFLYHTLYKTMSGVNEEFLSDNLESISRDYILYDFDSGFSYGFKGAWFKLKDNTLTIEAGVDVKKPIKFKSSLRLNLTLGLNDKTGNIDLKLKSAYLGNLVISKGILKTVVSKVASLRELINKYSSFPSNDPFVTCNVNSFYFEVDTHKALLYLKNKTTDKYLPEDELKVTNLYSKLEEAIKDKRVFDIKCEKGKLKLDVMANRAKTVEHFTKFDCDYTISDRPIDILRLNKTLLLLGFNNQSGITSTPADSFALSLDESRIRHIVRYFLEVRGYDSIFKKGFNISIGESEYHFKLELPDVYSYKSGVVQIRIFYSMSKVGSSEYEFVSYLDLKTRIDLIRDVGAGVADVVFEILEMKIGDGLNFTDYIPGIMAYLHNIELVSGNQIILKDFVVNLKSTTDYDIIHVEASENRVTIVCISENPDVVKIKVAVKEVLEYFTTDEDYKATYSIFQQDLEVLANDSSTVDEKSQAIDNILNSEKTIYTKFSDNFIFELSIRVGQLITNILRLKAVGE